MPETWPEGVIARYLTAAGVALADPALAVDITVDAVPSLHPQTYEVQPGLLDMSGRITCSGCGTTAETYGGNEYYEANREDMTRFLADRSRPAAQSHAETCRAMPRPTA